MAMDHCWILVGMMGAGKSSIGRALADASGRDFVDTDLLLQGRLGRPISQVFQLYGEDAFRSHESTVLRSLEPSPIVLATGGGIVIRDENWDEMRRLGRICYLRATPETLIERLDKSKKRRPLLDTESWEDRLRTLLNSRIPLYEKADFIVDVDQGEMEDAAERVRQAFQTMEAA